MAELKAIHDELDLLEALGPEATPRPPSFRVGNIGKQSSFDCDLDELQGPRGRSRASELGAVRTEVANACARRLGSAIRRFTLDAARERQRAGQLEFHDLLVLARALLRDPSMARRFGRRCTSATSACCSTSSRTPIPSRSSWPSASPRPTRRALRPAPHPGTRSTVTPGQLFVVGDPKQSIYRFRRADISTFLAAAARFGSEGGGVVELTANFRTVEPDHRLGQRTPSPRSWAKPDDVSLPVPSQPDYIALRADPAASGYRSDRSRFSDAKSTRREPGGRAPDGRGRRRGGDRGSGHPRGVGRRRRRRAAGDRPGSATSPSWFRPAPRCRFSRTPSTGPASRFGPSRVRSSTPAERCATC